MKIESIASFNEYASPSTQVAANAVNIPRVNLPLWTPIWTGTLASVNLNVEPMPLADSGQSRNWLRMRANSSNSTSTVSRHLEFRSNMIGHSLRNIGTTFCVGFHVATLGQYSPAARGIVGVRKPAASLGQIVNIPSTAMPNNERRWIDIVVSFLPEESEMVPSEVEGEEPVKVIKTEAMSSHVRVYFNRQLCEEFVSPPTFAWAIDIGDTNNMIFRSTTSAYGIGFNDFIVTSAEGVGLESVQETMVGPINVKPLTLADPIVNGRWQAPAGKTIKEGLGARMATHNDTLPAAAVTLSDPAGAKLTSVFETPEEMRPILAMTEYLIAQRPSNMASSLEYRSTLDGTPVGPTKRIDFPNTSNSHVVYTTTLGADDITQGLSIDQLTKRGVTINSVKTPIAPD